MTRSTLLCLALTCGLMLIGTQNLYAEQDEPTPAELSAEQIIQHLAKTYEELQTYQDFGEVNVTVGRRTMTRYFDTAFISPDRFRFETRDPELGESLNRHIVWRNKDDIRAWIDIMPKKDTRMRSLQKTLLNAAVASMGASLRVPSLLMPDDVQHQRIDKLTQTKRLNDAELNGQTCFRVYGNLDDLGVVLWIDQDHHLLRRLDTGNLNPDLTFKGIATTLFNPTINEEIPDENLAYPSEEDDKQEPKE